MDKWIGKDLEESGRGLTEGTILTFAWRDCENHEKSQSTQPVSGPRF
jgi:hypothetical protein